MSTLAINNAIGGLSEGSTINVSAGNGVLATDTGPLSVSAVGTASPTTALVSGSATLQGAYGTLVMHADGSYSYKALNNLSLPADGILQDKFSYAVTDSHGNTGQATLTVTVTAVGVAYVGAAAGQTVVVGNGATVIDASLGNVTVIGGNGNDVVIGGANDKIALGNGNDWVLGGANEIVTVGNGNDVITVGDNVAVVAGNGNDTITTGSNAIIAAGNGNDTITAVSNAAIVVGNGNDKISVGSNAIVAAGNGTDTVTAGSNAAIVVGNGNDTLAAGDNSAIFAGNGNDTVAIGANSFLDLENGAYSVTAGAGLTYDIDGVAVFADAASVKEDVTLTATGNVIANDVGGKLTVSTTGTFVGKYGSLSLAANGAYVYTLNNASAAVQQLAEGQTVTDVFAYTAGLGGGHGKSASNTLTVTVAGTNDAAVIGGVSTGSVTEDNGANGDLAVTLTTGGALTISDADAGQAQFAAQASTAGQYGTFTLAANGQWTYSANNTQAAIQQLGAGQSLTDSFTAKSLDGSASQVVTVTIKGTNDVAVIGGVSTGSVTEDNGANGDLAVTLTTGGALTVSDLDAGQAQFAAQASTAGQYGSFTLGANGQWTYSANNTQAAIQQLGAGQSLTDSFTAKSLDGSASQVVTVTIKGTNDVAVIGGVSTGSVTEDNGANGDLAVTLTTGGALTISDADAGQSQFVAQASAAGQYGSFTLAANGQWTYSANNTQAAIQQLGAGQSLTDSFTAKSLDGSASQVVTVTIKGTNDTPTIDAADTTAAATISEQSGLTGSNSPDGAAGTILFNDADLSDTHAFAVSGPSVTFSAVPGADQAPAAVKAANLQTLLAALQSSHPLQVAKTQDSTGGQSGALGWTFSMPDSAFDFLALGEAVTIGYNVTVTDNNGASVVEPLTIKVLGSADGPVFGNNNFDTNQDAAITSPVQFTLADEGRSASGFGIRQDVLPNGVVLTSPPSSSLPSLGHFSVTQAGAFTFDPGHDYDYLAQGETATETATVLVATDAGLSFTPVSVTVHGANDTPTIDAADTTAAATISEQSGLTGSNSPDGAAGTILFNDADLSDTHAFAVSGPSVTFSAVPGADQAPAAVKAANLQTLLAALQSSHPLQVAKTQDSTGGQSGALGWTFSMPDSAFDFLALGEAVTIGYNVTVTDNNGASVVEPLTIKVLGSADGPVFGNNTFDTNQDAAITSPIQFTLADEGRSASGFGIRQDVLPNGVVLTSPPSSSLPSLGHFSVTQAGAFTFDPGHDYDYLAQGETATETATVLVATDAGLSFTPVSVTVHGTNDAPVIAASTATGAITEQPGVTGSSVPDTASGEIDFRDADVSDTHTVTTDGASITFNPASPITDPARQKGVNAALDGLAKRLALDHPLQLSLSDTNGGAIGSVGWTFSRPDGALISWRRATR